MELIQTRAWTSTKPRTEVLHSLLARAMAHHLQSREDPLIHALVAGELGRRIPGARHPKHRLLDVARLERSVALRVLREGTGEAIGDRFILVRDARRVTELHRDR